MEVNAPVVVGYDGSGSALSALRWAAREAAERHLPLHVVRAVPYADAPRRAVGLTSRGDDHKGTDMLQEALRIANDAAVQTQIHASSVAGQAAGVLAAVSAGAEMVVVGQRSQDGACSTGMGSASRILVSRAHCPVVVARGATGVFRVSLPVVVGVTGYTRPCRALDFAARTAELRGVALVVLAGWSLPPSREWPRTRAGDTVADLARAKARSVQALARASTDYVRQHHPAVETRTEFQSVPVGVALQNASRRAGLLVVAAGTHDDPRDSRARRSTWDGERQADHVVEFLVEGAACPVAVIPDELSS